MIAGLLTSSSGCHCHEQQRICAGGCRCWWLSRTTTNGGCRGMRHKVPLGVNSAGRTHSVKMWHAIYLGCTDARAVSIAGRSGDGAVQNRGTKTLKGFMGH